MCNRKQPPPPWHPINWGKPSGQCFNLDRAVSISKRRTLAAWQHGQRRRATSWANQWHIWRQKRERDGENKKGKTKCSLWNIPPKQLDHLNLQASVIQLLGGSKSVHNKVLYSGNRMTPSVIPAHVWHELKVKSIAKSNISELNLSF